MGRKPNTKCITEAAKTCPTSDVIALDNTQHVQVNKHLQSTSHAHVFAGGDVANWDTIKRVGVTKAHANLVVQNIIAMDSRQALSSRVPLVKPVPSITVSNGPYLHTGVRGDFVYGPSSVLGTLKRAALYVGQIHYV